MNPNFFSLLFDPTRNRTWVYRLKYRYFILTIPIKIIKLSIVLTTKIFNKACFKSIVHTILEAC